MEHVILRRLKDGKEFAIPVKYVEDTLRQGFEVVTEIGMLPEKKTAKPTKEKQEKVEITCPLCGHVSATMDDLATHRKLAHAPKPAPTEQVFACEQCDKSFSKAPSLKRHMTRSHA